MKKFLALVQSKSFKRATFVLGIIFFLLTLLLAIDPTPFLKYGYLGVFAFNLFGPGTLLVPVLAQHMNVILLAIATTLGMGINDSVSYIVGRNSITVIPRSNRLETIEGTINHFGPIALFFWSLIPIPYDLIGFVAGYLGISYKSFLLPTFLGKFIRFLLLGYGVVAIFK